MSSRSGRPRIVVIGSLNMDLSLRVDHLPLPGETVLGDSLETAPGGKGANQAVAAARVGAEVAFVGRRGADAFGDELEERLRAESVDVTWLCTTEGVSTGTAMIWVDATGQNSIAVALGANALVTAADVDRAEEAIASAAVVLAQLEIPLAAVERAAELAERHGVPFVLNPAPARPLPESLLARTTLLVPNETELAMLFPGEDVPARLGAAHAAGARRVLVTLGAEGARYSEAGVEAGWSQPPFPVQAVDTTAAGDAFVGALAVRLARAGDLREAARFGAAAGALAVTRAGAQPSLPGGDDVERFLEDAAHFRRSDGELRIGIPRVHLK